MGSVKILVVSCELQNRKHLSCINYEDHKYHKFSKFIFKHCELHIRTIKRLNVVRLHTPTTENSFVWSARIHIDVVLHNIYGPLTQAYIPSRDVVKSLQ